MEQLTSAAPAIWNGFITSTWFITQWKVRLIGRDSSELGLPSPPHSNTTHPCCLAALHRWQGSASWTSCAQPECVPKCASRLPSACTACTCTCRVPTSLLQPSTQAPAQALLAGCLDDLLWRHNSCSSAARRGPWVGPFLCLWPGPPAGLVLCLLFPRGRLLQSVQQQSSDGACAAP